MTIPRVKTDPKCPWCGSVYPYDHKPNCSFMYKIAKAVEDDRRTRWYYRSKKAVIKLFRNLLDMPNLPL